MEGQGKIYLRSLGAIPCFLKALSISSWDSLAGLGWDLGNHPWLGLAKLWSGNGFEPLLLLVCTGTTVAVAIKGK